ncbi:efflux RND transporter periplasmic adaptor subunit [Serratia marcescens]|uniref:efflux RND transporter periplasmic adaptor subunit n=1 Tax=Serratia marcescens TaxID=615 RepID=UPI000F0D0B73|nr:efflux RND transporter periplasmic adaptor subunit [Serratia marcescens]BBG71867.1 drug-efflux protein [Serratia marcescens]
MKFTFTRLAMSVAIVLLLLVIILIRFLKHPDPATFVTATVRTGNIENTVLATGTLDAVRRVNVGAQASGQVKSLKVKLGDSVTRGQLVAEIDDLQQRNDLRNAEAALRGIRASQQAKQAQLKQAELHFRRQQQMQKENASSHEDYENAESTLKSTQAEVQRLEAQRIQAEIEVEKKKVELDYTHVQAPMDGTVIAVLTPQGQTVNSSQSAPTIIKLAQLDVMTIRARISEVDIAHVFPGLSARFTIFADPEQHYDATLRSVELAPESEMKDTPGGGGGSSSRQNAAVYYNALLDVPNPKKRLRIGMTTQVSLVLEEARHTLLVPVQAVNDVGGGKKQVQVLNKNNQPEPRGVKTGVYNHTDIQILEGLRVGEIVVLSASKSWAAAQGEK